MDQPEKQQRILLVDDTPSNIHILGEALQKHYTLQIATTGQAALNIANSAPPPDLILLDVMMPEMDGYEVCRRLKASAVTKTIPVIFVTAMSDIDDETHGFKMGAVDYITKPISPPIVLARVRTQLALYDQNRDLEERVKARTEELSKTQDATILSLATLAEYRDNETGGHITRTQHYVRILAEQLKGNSRFRDYLDRETIELFFKSAPLHDIGKVGINDGILLKPGGLTDQEFEEMKRHTIYGEEALIRAEQALGKDQASSFLRLAREIAASHHEKWDGTGYPRKLAGEEIPIAGRLMAIADIYDALVSKRVYKPPFPHGQSYDIIVKGDGRVMPTHFDPDVLAAFVTTHKEFKKIAKEFADSDEERKALDR